jgi:hypothetical protein
MTTGARGRHRTLKVTLLVVALLMVGAAVFASLRLDAIVNSIKNQQVAAAARALGRPVHVGRVSTHLFPLSVEIHDVAIAPDPNRPAETLPVMSLARLRVGVASKTFWSLGKRPGLSEVLVEGLTVNVIKHPDGTLNLQNLADSLPRKHPEPEQPKPMDPATREKVRNATIDRVRVTGQVHLVDLGRDGAAVDIGQIELALDDLSLSRSVAIALHAAVLAPTRNFTFAASLGAAPPALDGPPPLQKLTVKLDRTDLSPLAPFLVAALPADLTGLQSATAALDVDLQPGAAVPGGSGPTRARTSASLTGLRFSRGEPADLKLETDLSGDPAGTIDLRRFFFGLADMSLQAHGKLAGLQATPHFSDFVLESKGFDFDRLRRIVPDLDRRAGAMLRGPFSLWAKASGSTMSQTFDAGLDLSTASIEVPSRLRKPIGTPLRLDVHGKSLGNTLTIERFGLLVADWHLAARGSVHDMGTAAMTLAFDAEADAPGLAGILRLLPPVAKGLPPKARLDGTLNIKAKAVGAPTALHSELDLRLAGLAIKAPDARLGGGGTVTVRADKKTRALDATVRVDFTGLEATYADLVRKAAGVPLALNLVAAQTGGTQTVKLDLRAADLKVDGHAQLQPAGDDQAVTAEVNVPPFRVRSLTTMLPGLATAPLGDIRGGARVRVRGRLAAPESMEVTVDNLEVTAGKSDLHGHLTLANLERPRVDVEVKSAYLDLDELVPPGPKSDPKEKKKKREDGALDKVTGHVALAVTRGKAAGIPYQDLKADLRLVGGRAIANVMEVGVFGGHFSGSGTELSLLDDSEPFAAKGNISNLDLNAVISHFTGVPNLLGGRLDAKLALGGGGTAPAILEKTLEGVLEGGLQNAQLLGGSFADALLAPVAAKVNAIPGAGKLIDTSGAAFKKLSDRALTEVRASLAFDRGTLNLSHPVNLKTASGPIELAGRVFLGGNWDLGGQLALSPEAATALTANRLSFDRPLPIKLTVTGPITRPRVAPAAVDELAKVFAVAFARSAAGQALKGKLQTGAQEVLGRTGLRDKLPVQAASVDEARGKAEAEAAQARARAEADAEAARQRAAEATARAEAEARARADETKRNAGEAAKEKLKGILGR